MRGLASAVLDDLTLAVFKGHSPPGTGGIAGLGYEVRRPRWLWMCSLAAADTICSTILVSLFLPVFIGPALLLPDGGGGDCSCCCGAAVYI